MKQAGILELRSAMNLFSACREGFLQRFTAEELIRLYRAYRAGDWDIPPDRWSDQQIMAAAAFELPPRWGDDGIPEEPDIVGYLKQRQSVG